MKITTTSSTNGLWSLETPATNGGPDEPGVLPMRGYRGCALVAILVLHAIGHSGHADDWPMWRHDARRSAATPEQLPAVLHLHWVRDLPALRPAWPGQSRLRFDFSYQPIVTGKLLIIGSNANDRVTAYDTDTGDEVWRFYAEGPVRFAPAAWQGKVYVASDDGYLYCLDASAGQTVWRFRGGPSDRKVLGNQRLISMWPSRTGPVVHEGVVYFTASIWPFMGTFLYALDAETGDIIWRNDATGSRYMLQPHSSPAFAGLAPQGYLALSGDRLIVPNGRSVPAALDSKTGQLLYYHLAQNKSIGSCHVVATREHFVNSGVLFRSDDGGSITAFHDSPVVHDNVAFYTSGAKLRAVVLTSPVAERYLDDEGKASTRITHPQVMAFDCGSPVHIKAGNRLYAGAEGVVQVIEVERRERGATRPGQGREKKDEDDLDELEDELAELEGEDDEATTGLPESMIPEPRMPAIRQRSAPPPFVYVAKLAAEIKIDGTPSGMLAADGKLFVVTQDHRLYCFGAEEAEAKTHPLIVEPAKPRDDGWGRRASDILKRSGVTEGYCVILGVGAGRLLRELADQSQLQLIVIEPDRERIERMRRELDAAGLYGTRVHIVAGTLATVSLPPYLADLITSEKPIERKELVRRVFHSLRPYGGTALLPLEPRTHKAFMQAVVEAGLPGAEAKVDGEFVRLTRVGALPGSADWTHQYGDAANTVLSRDRLVKAPLGLLWFGGSTNEEILPRHGHGPTPQVAGGRLFIEGMDLLRAVDVYTGRVLWEADLPGLGEPYNYTGHQPGANSLGSNYVSLADGVYVVYQGKCLRLDPTTGRKTAEFVLPPDPATQEIPQWGYIGISGDLLLAGANPLDVWQVYFSVDEFGEIEPAQLKACTSVVDGLVDFEALEQVPAVAESSDGAAEEAEPIPIRIVDGIEATDPSRKAQKKESVAAPDPDLEELEDLEDEVEEDDGLSPEALMGVEPAGPPKEATVQSEASSQAQARTLTEVRLLVANLNRLLNQESLGRHVPDAVKASGDAEVVDAIEQRLHSEQPKGVTGFYEARKVRELQRKLLETWYPQLPKKARGPLGRYSLDATASKRLVAMDRHTGKVRWTFAAEHSFRHNAIAIGGGRVFAIDRLPAPILDRMQRRGKEFSGQFRILALDAKTGRRIWSTAENVFGTWLGYSQEHDILVQAGRRARDMVRDEPGQRIIAYRGRDGTVLWDEPHVYGGPLILHGDTIIAQGNAFGLLTGRPKMRRNPFTGKEEPWRFRRNYGCNTAVAGEHLLTFRSAAAGYYDLRNDSGTGNFGGFKSSCTSNLVVANGVLNAPDYTRTCLCSYQNQSSLALVHMPEVEQWTFSSVASMEGAIRRLGVNFGAPGDHLAGNGTMWLEHPTVGGPSPAIPLRVEPEDPSVFRFHPSRIKGGDARAVAASGVRGIMSLMLTLCPPEALAEDLPYTVRLYFVEPDGKSPGERVFDVAINGEVALEDFDVAREAGGPYRAVAREFTQIAVANYLTVTFTATGPPESNAPVLSGIEIEAEFVHELPFADEKTKAANETFCFVPKWRISNIIRPTGGEDHGLADALKEDVTRPIMDLPTDENGFLNIRPLWQRLAGNERWSEGYQCIAEAWVFSPVARRVKLGFGPDRWGIVWLNGKESLAVREDEEAVKPHALQTEAPVRQGWNRVRVRLSGGPRGLGFWFSIFDPADLQYTVGDEAPPWPTEWPVAAVAGTFVSEKASRRQKDYSQHNVLYVSGKDGQMRRALVRWPTDLLPPDTDPETIRARFILTRAWHEGGGEVGLRPVLTAWDESETSFERQPALGKPLPVRTDVSASEWVFEGAAIDAMVRGWMAHPEANCGVAIESDIPGYAAFFSDDEERAPSLVLERKRGLR